MTYCDAFLSTDWYPKLFRCCFVYSLVIFLKILIKTAPALFFCNFVMSISQCPQVVLLFSAVANNYWKVGVGRGKGSPCRILYFAFVFVFKSGCSKRPNKYLPGLFCIYHFHSEVCFWICVFCFLIFNLKLNSQRESNVSTMISFQPIEHSTPNCYWSTEFTIGNVSDENICILWCRLPLLSNAIVCWPVQGEEGVVRVVWDG